MSTSRKPDTNDNELTRCASEKYVEYIDVACLLFSRRRHKREALSDKTPSF